MVLKRIFFFVFLFQVAALIAQTDSCNCFDFPFIGRHGENNFFVDFKNEETKTPYNGVCRVYGYTGGKIDATKKQRYGKFKKGRLWYYEVISPKGDTELVFKRVNRDSVFAELKQYDIISHQLSYTITYYLKKGKRYAYRVSYYDSLKLGNVSTSLLPDKNDSLKSWYKLISDESEYPLLNSDGFFDIPVRMGKSVSYAKDGKTIVEEGWYNHDQLTGIYKEWYNNGVPKKVAHYNYKGDPIIESREWYENGQIKLEKQYCGYSQCLYKEWYENGTLKSSSKRHPFKPSTDEQWHENGVRSLFAETDHDSICTYQRKTTWFANGIKEYESEHFSQNKKVHLHYQKNYFTNGNLKDETFYHEKSIFPKEENYYFESGRLNQKRISEADNRSSTLTTFDTMGNLFSIEAQVVADNYTYNNFLYNAQQIPNRYVRDGKCTWYFPNGKKWKECNFKNNIRDSVYNEWNEKGKLIFSQTFDEGEALTKTKYPLGNKNDIKRTKKEYKDEIDILSAMTLNGNDTSYNKYLFAPPTLKGRVTTDLVALNVYLQKHLQELAIPHMDRPLFLTCVQLEVPFINSEFNTKDSTLYLTGTKEDEQWFNFIRDLGLRPTSIKTLKCDSLLGNMISDYEESETYDMSKDRSFIYKKYFASPHFFNGNFVNRHAKNIDSKFSCRYIWPFAKLKYFEHSHITGIQNEHYSTYHIVQFLPPFNRWEHYYIDFVFNVYKDGSVDLIDQSKAPTLFKRYDRSWRFQ